MSVRDSRHTVVIAKTWRCHLLAVLELKALEGEAHGAFAVVGPASIFVLLDDQLLGEIEERVVHVRAILGACLHDRDPRVLLLKLLNFFICDLNLGLVIHFIGKDHNFDVGA